MPDIMRLCRVLFSLASQTQKLKDVINARNLGFGNTQPGKDWCIKALHPSDPITEVRGIPDRSAFPTVLQNYQMTYRFTCDSGATGTWAFEAVQLPHPVQFAVIKVTDSVGTRYLYPANSQIDGANVGLKNRAFIAQAQRWRLAYAGMTVYQDAPALANQGTIVAAQVPFSYYYLNRSGKIRTAGVNYTAGCMRVGIATSEDVPNFINTQAMPNAYFGRSEHGCYMPLKLTETSQDWASAADMFVPASDVLDKTTIVDTGSYVKLDTGGAPGGWPLYTTAVASNQWGATYTDTDVVVGDAVTPLLNGVVGHLCAQNLAVTTSFTLFFRMGIEMQVVPTSSMSPHQKLSPAFDPLALDTYFAISRELKDAYPVDYNDLGKIWDVISSVAKTVGPFIPGIGPVISGVATIGDKIKGAVEAAKKRAGPAIGEGMGNVSSMADVDLAQKTTLPRLAPPVARLAPRVPSLAAVRKRRRRIAKRNL